MEEKVILVDNNDRPLGELEKLQAHQKGLLHRAFSVFVFNSKGDMLLQRRALTKYHSPGLWTNACCSHPRPGEEVLEAAHRRLQEEMGFDTDLVKAFDFVYNSDVGQGLTEHEFDHVFLGTYNNNPVINQDEVHEWRFTPVKQIVDDMNQNPDRYTVWFKIAFDRLIKYYEETKNS